MMSLYTQFKFFVIVGVLSAGCKTTRMQSNVQDDQSIAPSIDGYAALPVSSIDGTAMPLPEEPTSGWTEVSTADSQLGLADESNGMRCVCPSTRVSCSTPLPPGAGARAFPKTCSIGIPGDSCAQFNYQDGSVVNTVEVMNWQLSSNDGRFIYQICSLRHEVKHVCDGPIRGCQAEQNAYTLSAGCFSEFFQQNHCTEDPNTTVCQRIAGNFNMHMVAKYINLCKCAGANQGPCIQECSKVYNAAACKQVGQQYFRPEFGR